MQCEDVGRNERVVIRKALPNFVARGEEQPLEGEFDFHFDLLFNAVDYPFLSTGFPS